jgi:hypothetical protein
MRGSAPGLAEMLHERRYRSELWSTGGRCKEERFERHLHFFVHDWFSILVKRNKLRTTALADDWLRVPFARHDDQVDAMRRVWQYLATNGRGHQPRIPRGTA